MDTSDEALKQVEDLLAQGYSFTHIGSVLAHRGFTKQQVHSLMDQIHTLWSEEPTDLVSLRSYHVQMRHVLLERALKLDSPGGLHLALDVLESLARIQGVVQSAAVGSGGEVVVSLVPKQQTQEPSNVSADATRRPEGAE